MVADFHSIGFLNLRLLKPLGKTTEDVTDVVSACSNLIGNRSSWFGKEWTATVFPVQVFNGWLIIGFALVVVATINTRAWPAEDGS